MCNRREEKIANLYHFGITIEFCGENAMEIFKKGNKVSNVIIILTCLTTRAQCYQIYLRNLQRISLNTSGRGGERSRASIS